MTILIPFVPFLLLFLFGRTGDPSPGLFTTKADAARFECRHVTREAADRDRPGALKEKAPRGDWIDEEVFRCRAPFFPRGERPGRIDALLDALGLLVAEIVTAAEESVGTESVTWGVLAHHDEPRVAGKVRFALEVELRGRGKDVRGELPDLAAADIAALSQLPPAEGYPRLCRLLPTGDKAWLAAFSVDPKETVLHAGVCAKEGWTWLL